MVAKRAPSVVADSVAGVADGPGIPISIPQSCGRGYQGCSDFRYVGPSNVFEMDDGEFSTRVDPEWEMFCAYAATDMRTSALRPAPRIRSSHGRRA
jgi:hypothetical protein